MYKVTPETLGSCGASGAHSEPGPLLTGATKVGNKGMSPRDCIGSSHPHSLLSTHQSVSMKLVPKGSNSKAFRMSATWMYIYIYIYQSHGVGWCGSSHPGAVDVTGAPHPSSVRHPDM